MTIEMRNCLKRLRGMFIGLKQIMPGYEEYTQFREVMDFLGISQDDLRAWSVFDFKERRPPTEKQMRGMLGYCKKWDFTNNLLAMRFDESTLDDFETAINDYVFLGEQPQ